MTGGQQNKLNNLFVFVLRSRGLQFLCFPSSSPGFGGLRGGSGAATTIPCMPSYRVQHFSANLKHRLSIEHYLLFGSRKDLHLPRFLLLLEPSRLPSSRVQVGSSLHHVPCTVVKVFEPMHFCEHACCAHQARPIQIATADDPACSGTDHTHIRPRPCRL